MIVSSSTLVPGYIQVSLSIVIAGGALMFTGFAEHLEKEGPSSSNRDGILYHRPRAAKDRRFDRALPFSNFQPLAIS
jgi:hypothetical protein